MSNAKRIVDYIEAETKRSGVAKYPIAIKEIAAELTLDYTSLRQELGLLRNHGIIEFCALGNTSVRLNTR